MASEPQPEMGDPEAWRVGDRVPRVVHLPATIEEVAALLSQASRDGTRIVPAGPRSASGIDGGAAFLSEAATARAVEAGEAGTVDAVGAAAFALALPPEGPYAILCTAALAGVTEYEPANLTITAGAGTRLPDLAECAAEHGQWLPVDPAGARAMTLGSLLATGAHGSLRAGFGRPRDHALGLTAVTGDGRVLGAGGRVVKNVAGFDLVRLMVGSGGKLGVITSATVRLFPLPASDATLVRECATAHEAVSLASALGALPVPVAALDLLDPGEAGSPTVAVRVMGGVQAVEETLLLLRAEAGMEEAERLDAEASRRFWDAANACDGRAQALLSLAFRPSRLGAAVAAVDSLRDGLSGALGETLRFTAHAQSGGGRVVFDHLSFATKGSQAEWSEKVSAFARHAASHGVACRLGSPSSDPVVARLEAGLKAAFDPGGVLP